MENLFFYSLKYGNRIMVSISSSKIIKEKRIQPDKWR